MVTSRNHALVLPQRYMPDTDGLDGSLGSECSAACSTVKTPPGSCDPLRYSSRSSTDRPFSAINPESFAFSSEGRRAFEAARQSRRLRDERYAATTEMLRDGGIFHRLVDFGLLGLTLPEDCGGQSGSCSAFATAVEELTRVCRTTSLVYVVHNAAAQVIVEGPASAGRSTVLGRIARGRHLAGMAFPQSLLGLDDRPSRLRVGVSARSGNNVTWGRRSGIVAASKADSYVSFCAHQDIEIDEGLTPFILDSRDPGVRVVRRNGGETVQPGNATTLWYADSRVNPSTYLGVQGSGMNCLEETVFPWLAIGFSSIALGLMRVAFEIVEARLMVNATRVTGRGRVRGGLNEQIEGYSANIETIRGLRNRAMRLWEYGYPQALSVLGDCERIAVQAAVEAVEFSELMHSTGEHACDPDLYRLRCEGRQLANATAMIAAARATLDSLSET